MTADRSNALIVGCLGVVVAGTLAIAFAQDRSEARPADPLTPYENCLLAANDPGPSGFAGEVCEPLRDDWTEPVVTLRPDDFRPGARRVLPGGGVVKRGRRCVAYLEATGVYDGHKRVARVNWGSFNVADGTDDLPLWQLFWPDEPESVDYRIVWVKGPVKGS